MMLRFIRLLKNIDLKRISLLAIILAVAVQQPASAVTSTQSIAIPAYEYPTLTDLWPDIDAAGGDDIPFVIVNPASGPGVSANSDYTTRISNNTAGDIRSIGYVDTNYQTRSVTDVIDDIDLWHSLYPGVTGIFLDRVSVDDSAALCYSAYIYNYIKVNYPDDLAIHNFGTYASPDYEPYGDIFLTAEMDDTLYQTWSAPTDGFHDDASNSNRFWHLIHTTDVGDYPGILTDTRNNNAGWVYITDDVLPNPYDAAASYFSTEVTDVGTLPSSTIPNRGVTELPVGCLDTSAATDTVSDDSIITSTHTLTNNSSIYAAPSPNELEFSLPEGVSLTSATGTNWTCTGNSCSYDNPLATSEASSILVTAFAVDCSYASGNITMTATTFPAHTETSSINVDPLADCPVDSGSGGSGGDGGSANPDGAESSDDELAETGDSTQLFATAAAVLLTIGVLALLYHVKQRRRYN